MHSSATIISIVFSTRRPKIAFFVNVNSIIIRYECPNSHIKLSSFIKKRFFDVFLYDPESFFLIFLKNELSYISKISKNFNASALVKCCWFYDPHVILAMLVRNSFIFAAPFSQLSKTIHELLNVTIVCRPCYHKSCRGRIKKRIMSSFSRFEVFIIAF